MYLDGLQWAIRGIIGQGGGRIDVVSLVGREIVALPTRMRGGEVCGGALSGGSGPGGKLS